MKTILQTFLFAIIATILPFGMKSEEKLIDGVPYIKLNNGTLMPRFGIGTFNDPGDSVAADAVLFALKTATAISTLPMPTVWSAEWVRP